MEAVEWSFTGLDKKSTQPRVVITSIFYNAWFQQIILHGTLDSLTTNGTEIGWPGSRIRKNVPVIEICLLLEDE